MKLEMIARSLVFMAILLLATACARLPPESGPATPEAVSPDGVQRITVLVGNETRFAPSRLVVKAGKPVTLTLRSIGLAPHDFVLTNGSDEPIRIAVDGGRTATATFTLPKAGTYRFICSVPGHSDAGMHGTIVAEE